MERESLLFVFSWREEEKHWLMLLLFCFVLSKTQPREVSSKSHQIRNQIIIFYEIVPLILISLPVIPFVFYDFPLFDI